VKLGQQVAVLPLGGRFGTVVTPAYRGKVRVRLDSGEFLRVAPSDLASAHGRPTPLDTVLALRPKPHVGAEMFDPAMYQPSLIGRNPPPRPREVHQMRAVLTKHGLAPAMATRLLQRGMSPSEIDFRLKMGERVSGTPRPAPLPKTNPSDLKLLVHVTEEGDDIVAKCCTVQNGEHRAFEARVNLRLLAQALRAQRPELFTPAVGFSLNDLNPVKIVKDIAKTDAVKTVVKTAKSIAKSPVVQAVVPPIAIAVHTIDRALGGSGVIKGDAGRVIDAGAAAATAGASVSAAGVLTKINPAAAAALASATSTLNKMKTAAETSGIATTAKTVIEQGKTAATLLPASINASISTTTATPAGATAALKAATQTAANIAAKAAADIAKKDVIVSTPAGRGFNTTSAPTLYPTTEKYLKADPKLIDPKGKGQQLNTVTRELVPGRAGDDVLGWQEFLVSLGVKNVPLTGIYDRTTELLTRTFQIEQKLPVTNKVDQATRNKAIAVKWEATSKSLPTVPYVAGATGLSGITRVLASGSRGDDVKVWQKFLSTQPGADGKTLLKPPQTGIFDSALMIMTSLFQKTNGLPVTGRVDSATLARAMQLEAALLAAAKGAATATLIENAAPYLAQNQLEGEQAAEYMTAVADQAAAGDPEAIEQEQILQRTQQMMDEISAINQTGFPGMLISAAGLVKSAPKGLWVRTSIAPSGDIVYRGQDPALTGTFEAVQGVPRRRRPSSHPPSSRPRIAPKDLGLLLKAGLIEPAARTADGRVTAFKLTPAGRILHGGKPGRFSVGAASKPLAVSKQQLERLTGRPQKSGRILSPREVDLLRQAIQSGRIKISGSQPAVGCPIYFDGPDEMDDQAVIGGVPHTPRSTAVKNLDDARRILALLNLRRARNHLQRVKVNGAMTPHTDVPEELTERSDLPDFLVSGAATMAPRSILGCTPAIAGFPSYLMTRRGLSNPLVRRRVANYIDNLSPKMKRRVLARLKNAAMTAVAVGNYGQNPDGLQGPLYPVRYPGVSGSPRQGWVSVGGQNAASMLTP